MNAERRSDGISDDKTRRHKLNFNNKNECTNNRRRTIKAGRTSNSITLGAQAGGKIGGSEIRLRIGAKLK